MLRNEALAVMRDQYGPGWPRDWYSMEMDLGWAFISPNRPGLIVVVASNRRVDDLRYSNPQGATEAAGDLLKKPAQ